MPRTARHNLSTSSVKNQLEALVSYSESAVKVIGTGSVTAPSTITYTAGTDTIEAVYGEDLVLRAAFPVQATADAVYTITGTQTDDSALTGAATMPANSPQGRSIDVTPTPSATFKTVTGMSVVGGVAGDKVEILTVPADNTFSLLSYFEGIEINTGAYLRSIPNRYDPSDHKKRQRQENRITMSQLYQNHADGLAQVEGKEVTLMLQVEDDGGGSITETILLSNADVSTPVNFAKDADAVVRGEGSFSRKIVFC